MTIRQLLNLATKKLAKSKSTSPELDAEVLLSHALDQPKEYLLTNFEKKLDPKLEKKFLILLNRHLIGWPVAYLTNHKEFFGLKFYVDKNVLIPRPETEGLVELVLKKIKNRSNLKILDIGTGSGCIIITLARSPLSRGRTFFASDISSKAIAIAKKNAKRHKIKITFRHGSLLEPWKNQQFNVIIANLPYLTKQTDPSTKFEPKRALIAAKKGLQLYEKLFEQISLIKLPQFIFLEIGHDQTGAIKKLAKKFLPAYETKIFKDLAKRSRYAVLEKKYS